VGVTEQVPVPAAHPACDAVYQRWILGLLSESRTQRKYQVDADTAFGGIAVIRNIRQLKFLILFDADAAFAETCTTHYYRLRDYMLEHPEIRDIVAAID
jgi:hypothetical protein